MFNFHDIPLSDHSSYHYISEKSSYHYFTKNGSVSFFHLFKVCYSERPLVFPSKQLCEEYCETVLDGSLRLEILLFPDEIHLYNANTIPLKKQRVRQIVKL